MPLQARTYQTNFSAGQVDPRMLGREDINVFANAGSDLTNSSPLVQGGIRRRPGTVFLSALTGETRLERFRFNETQLYIFAFSNTELKIFNAAGTLLQTLTGQPWTATTMYEMRMTTSGDTTIITHEDWGMRSLLRTGATTFTMSLFAFDAHSSGYPRYVPFFKFAAGTITLTPSATSGVGITLTTSSAYWTADHVGSIVRYKEKEIDVTAFTNSTVVVGTVRETLAATSADTEWDENVFSAANGYARSVVFHSRRLWFGGSRDLPNFLFGSQANQFFNFSVGTGLDAESIQGSIGTDEVNNIMHLHSGRHLQIFTDAAVMYLRESLTQVVTPSAFEPRFTTPYGSSNATPVRLDGATLFVQDTKKVVRELIFNDLQDSYTADPISLVSNDMITGATKLAVFYGNTSGPEQWCNVVNEDGTMAIYHSVRSEKINSWYAWTTNGEFESITQLNGIMYASVKRSIPQQATCTITVTDAENIAVGTTITITDNAGVSTTMTGTATNPTTNPNEFSVGVDNASTADNIAVGADAVLGINALSGYTAPNPAANVITVTRVVPGGDNLTVVSSDPTRIAVTDFTGGTTDVRYLEKFDFDTTVDCAATLSLVSGTTWGGLTHLVSGGFGYNASVIEGTLFHGDFTVASTGRVTLDEEPGSAPVGGLDYTRTIKDMPPVVAGPTGSTMGVRKRIGSVVLRVFETVNFSVEGQEFLIRQVTSDLEATPTPVTQTYEFHLTGWTRDGQVTITQTAPLPFTLLSMWKELLV